MKKKIVDTLSISGLGKLHLTPEQINGIIKSDCAMIYTAIAVMRMAVVTDSPVIELALQGMDDDDIDLLTDTDELGALMKRIELLSNVVPSYNTTMEGE